MRVRRSRTKGILWTEEEKSILRECYDPNNLPGVMKRLPRRTRKSILLQAKMLGLTQKYIGLTEERKTKLLEMHQKGCIDSEISDSLGVNRSRITDYRRKLGLPVNYVNFKLPTARKAESLGFPPVTTSMELWILKFVKLKPLTAREVLKYLGLSVKSFTYVSNLCSKLYRKGYLLRDRYHYIYPNYNYEDVPDTLGEFDVETFERKKG